MLESIFPCDTGFDELAEKIYLNRGECVSAGVTGIKKYYELVDKGVESTEAYDFAMRQNYMDENGNQIKFPKRFMPI